MDKAMAPTRFPRAGPLGSEGPNCRTIIAPVETSWTEPAIFEWELKAESWTDQHPHCEYNYVIEGQLFVALAGDVVRVPAGAVGRYWAPRYARLLAVYGPNAGEPSRSLGYEKLKDPGGSEQQEHIG